MDYSISILDPLNQGRELQYDFMFSLHPKTDDPLVSSPGLTSVFGLASSFVDSVKTFFNAVKHYDKEQIVEHLIRIFNLPIGIASCIERLIALLYLIIAGITYVTLSLQACILGLIFLAIELGLEISRLLRSLAFRMDYPVKTAHNLLSALDVTENIDTFINEHKNDLKKILSPEILDTIQHDSNELKQQILNTILPKIYKNYFTLSIVEAQELSDRADTSARHGGNKKSFLDGLVQRKMQTKLNSFAKRIRPWAVKDFYSTMTFYNLAPPIVQGQKLIAIMNEQLDKTTLIHIIGIVAIAIATISLSFSLILFPPALPLILGTIGIVMEFGRGFAPNSFLDQQGWQWNWRACLFSPPRRQVPFDGELSTLHEMKRIDNN